MKMIPKNEFITILNLNDSNLLSEEVAKKLFELYGDDYFFDDNKNWELCIKNEKREKLLER